MTSGPVNASFSLPEWQAVKVIFFAPWYVFKVIQNWEMNALQYIYLVVLIFCQQLR